MSMGKVDREHRSPGQAGEDYWTLRRNQPEELMQVVHVLLPTEGALARAPSAPALIIVDDPAAARELIPLRSEVVVAEPRTTVKNHHCVSPGADRDHMQGAGNLSRGRACEDGEGKPK